MTVEGEIRTCHDEHENFATSVEQTEIVPSKLVTWFTGTAVNFISIDQNPDPEVFQPEYSDWNFVGWLDNTIVDPTLEKEQKIAYIEYREEWNYIGGTSIEFLIGQVSFFFNPDLYYGKTVRLIVKEKDKSEPYMAKLQDVRGELNGPQVEFKKSVDWIAFYIPGDDIILAIMPTQPHAGQTVKFHGKQTVVFDGKQVDVGSNNHFILRTSNSDQGKLISVSFFYQGYIDQAVQDSRRITIGLEMYLGSKQAMCSFGETSGEDYFCHMNDFILPLWMLMLFD